MTSPRYRRQLPQAGNRLFLTDGGLETTLVFLDGMDLPLFSAFPLAGSEAGRARLRDYFRQYLDIARHHRLGFILEAPTWRASRGWAERLGIGADQLAVLNRASIDLLEELRLEYDSPERPHVISGCVGPHGDGYQVGSLSVQQALDYHLEQVATFATTAADLIGAITMTTIAEATGITLAAREMEMPVAVSFTVETDGRLPGGESLQQAIAGVDAATNGYAAYYMVNCAHPSHFEQSLPGGQELLRLRGIRANASKCSHEELDNSTELDDGNPQEFGEDYRRLRVLLPALAVVGGCCGTDHRHIEHICHHLAA